LTESVDYGRFFLGKAFESVRVAYFSWEKPLKVCGSRLFSGKSFSKSAGRVFFPGKAFQSLRVAFIFREKLFKVCRSRLFSGKSFSKSAGRVYFPGKAFQSLRVAFIFRKKLFKVCGSRLFSGKSFSKSAGRVYFPGKAFDGAKAREHAVRPARCTGAPPSPPHPAIPSPRHAFVVLLRQPVVAHGLEEGFDRQPTGRDRQQYIRQGAIAAREQGLHFGQIGGKPS